MKKDSIEQLFNRLENQFDTENPSENHQASFLEKLQHLDVPQTKARETPVRKLNWVKPMLVAACLLLIFGVILTTTSVPQYIDLADISPEMEQTQTFFTQTIERELSTIQEEVTPETQGIVDNALVQMNRLETQYKNLKNDLVESGQDKRVIYAMIDNFQNRIDLLEQVLEHIEATKNLNDLRPQNI
jgi:hypothetical protein